MKAETDEVNEVVQLGREELGKPVYSEEKISDHPNVFDHNSSAQLGRPIEQKPGDLPLAGDARTAGEKVSDGSTYSYVAPIRTSHE